MTRSRITCKLSLSRTSTPSSKVISALVVVKEETRSRKERAGNSMVCKVVRTCSLIVYKTRTFGGGKHCLMKKQKKFAKEGGCASRLSL